MSSRLQTIYNEQIKISLQKKMKYKSSMEVPSITKITINVGLGEAVSDCVLDKCVKYLKNVLQP